MKSTLIFLFSFSFSFSICSFGQVSFQTTIGGSDVEDGFSIINSDDGGYVVCGFTLSYGTNGDLYIVKLDSNSNLQWTKTIGGTNWDSGNSITQTNDGGYIACGNTRSFGPGDNDVYVVKINSMGNLQWTKTIGGIGEDYGASIVCTKDGGYAIGGTTDSFGQGVWDSYIVKLDSNGNIEWSNTVGSTNYETGNSIIQTSDNGYALCGQSSGVYIVKLDSSGILQWTKTIFGDWGVSIVQTQDQGYAVVGKDGPIFTGDILLIKLDSTGGFEWSKTVGGSGQEEAGSIILTKDKGYIVGGFTTSFGSDSGDIYVSKLDSVGNLQWSKTFGGVGYDAMGSMVHAKSGYAICGYTSSFGKGYNDIYVLKLDSNGNSCDSTGSGGIVGIGGGVMPFADSITYANSIIGNGGVVGSGGVLTNICFMATVNDIAQSDIIQIYPNPSDGFLNLQMSAPIAIGIENMQIRICNVLGECIHQQICRSSNLHIDLNSQPNGIYFLQLRTEDGILSKKICISR